jgi:putative photosynthetic complex assembly protein 2
MTIVWPLLFAVLVWWFGTGAVLYLNGLPRATFKWTMLGSTLVLAAAVAGLVHSSQQTTVMGAYCAFTCAVLIWSWQEIGFLLGYITGSRRVECPPEARGWARWRMALDAVNHHELALLGLFVLVWGASAGAPNQTGLWTFVVLWLMRQSAKLNIFLGVRNLNGHFLPTHLRYLESYFTQRRFNALFPFSVVVSTGIAIPLWQSALGSSGTFQSVSHTLVVGMLSLAILEHLLMVLPVNLDALWRWGFASRK